MKDTGVLRVLRGLLRLSLFFKLLIANAVLVLLVAAATAFVAFHVTREAAPPGSAQLLFLVAFWGVLVTVFVNAAIVWLALDPLERLQQTAGRVRAGDLDARAEVSPLADRNLARLTITFNEMLDSSAADRQRLRVVAARALSAAEEERKRIARELHDGIAQSLAALRLRLRLARAEAQPDVLREQLDDLSAGIGEAIDEVRRIAHGLRPAALDMLGLGPAIDSYARAISETDAVFVDVQAEEVAGMLSPEEELALYRIVQEALSNVMRHSNAKRAHVQLRRTDRGVEAVVEDDGRGFDFDAINRDGERGLGLFGMQERAGYLGGQVTIVSKPGSGTRVTVAIPSQQIATHG